MNGAIGHARSFLFVPGDRMERLPKALGSGAHAVVADLEDAVAPDHKPAARAAIAAAVNGLSQDDRRRMLVRVNAVGTEWHADDLTQLPRRIGGILLAKAESAEDVMRVARACEVPVLALVESARGFTALASIARTPGILRLVFGHLDFQADIGMQSGVEERELDSIRMAFALASRNANLSAPVDGVTVDLDDLVRLRADAQRSRRFGFGAKLCVHPNQVDAVNEALAPTPAECEWARRVVDAGANAGKGAFRLDAQMVDAPVLLRARRILDQAGPPM